MCSLSKIHKPLIKKFPKLRPILSAINTATYGWAKFFVPLFKCFTMNEYTIKDSLTLANIFLCYHKSNWMKDCPKDFKPVYYKRYVDDIFFRFNKLEHARFFLEFINKKHKNMKFSIETEINGSLSFLDVKIFRENNKFVTSVYRKETFSGVYTNFISFIPLEYKFGLVHTLLNRCFNLSSDFLKFHHEVDKLKKILSKNAYPQKFIDKCIQKFLNNMFIQRLQIPTVPKKELIIILPYLGKMSQIVKTRLTKTMNKHMKFCKLRVIFQINNRLRNFFSLQTFCS